MALKNAKFQHGDRVLYRFGKAAEPTTSGKVAGPPHVDRHERIVYPVETASGKVHNMAEIMLAPDPAFDADGGMDLAVLQEAIDAEDRDAIRGFLDTHEIEYNNRMRTPSLVAFAREFARNALEQSSDPEADDVPPDGDDSDGD